MDKLALSEVSLRVLRFSPASIVPSALHTYHPRCGRTNTQSVHVYRLSLKCVAELLVFLSSLCAGSVTANCLPQSMLHNPSEADSFSSIQGILRIYGTRKLTTVFTRSLHLSIS